MEPEESEYQCALSGKDNASVGAELVEDARDDDSLEDLPLGWLKVTVQRRVQNPTWEQLQYRKARLLEGMKLSIPSDAPDDDRREMTADLEISLTAQFAVLDAQIPRYVTEEEDCFILDPSKDKQVQKAWDTIAGELGLDLGATESDDEE